MTDQEESNREDDSAGDSDGEREQERGVDSGRVETLKQSVEILKLKVDDQKQRIDSLARGREQGMEVVAELRAELSLVAAERDRLRKQLTELEGMQVETMTLGESDAVDETNAHQGELPSIDELMSKFGGDDDGRPSPSHTTFRVGSGSRDPSGQYQEMISPELIIFGSGSKEANAPAERFLIMLEVGNHTKCLLDQDLLTIGRSESADIQVDGDYISRIHVRILRIGMDTVIEDADSKNGTWVNGEQTKRHVLKHGDLIRVGSVNFRLVDSAAMNGGGK